MRLYTVTGRRSAALRQYRKCRDVLPRELNLQPEEETDRLYRSIKSGGAFVTEQVQETLRNKPEIEAYAPAGKKATFGKDQ
ncbi:MAG: bacterial transcriptional activator domain-containing protein [Spirochaetaceae bacterium]|nr:MAG: bacterial transcriptional activator domain-containing protein [Spirochaetaceae bacterium]